MDLFIIAVTTGSKEGRNLLTNEVGMGSNLGPHWSLVDFLILETFSKKQFFRKRSFTKLL